VELIRGRVKKKMKKKIFSITVVVILLILGISTVSEARMSIKNVKTQETLNEPIVVGSATIYGDGIEGNQALTATIDIPSELRVNATGDLVDLKLEYDIDCDGDEDLGIIILMAQQNGRSVGEGFVLTTENETGYVVIDNVLLKKEEVIEILSIEVAVIYFNTDPQFHEIVIDTGLSIIRERSRHAHQRIHNFPLIQSLLRLPRIAKSVN
jgi:hypothetical protein